MTGWCFSLSACRRLFIHRADCFVCCVSGHRDFSPIFTVLWFVLYQLIFSSVAAKRFSVRQPVANTVCLLFDAGKVMYSKVFVLKTTACCSCLCVCLSVWQRKKFIWLNKNEFQFSYFQMSLSRSLDYFCFLSFCCPCLNLLLFSGPLFTRLSSAWVVLSDSASHRGVVVFFSVLSNWKRKFLLLQHFFNEPDLKGPLRLHGFFEAAEKKSRTKSWTPESWAVRMNVALYQLMSRWHLISDGDLDIDV